MTVDDMKGYHLARIGALEIRSMGLGFGNWFRMFQPVTCDECGEDCSINTTLVRLSARYGQESGELAIVDKVPGEIGYCEYLDLSTCDDCYVDEDILAI